MLYTSFRGIALSRQALGTWINFAGKASDTENRKILQGCLKAGINVIDTAGSYEDGKAEALLGELLKLSARKELFLSTKIFFRPPQKDGRDVSGLNKKVMKLSLDESLQRLKTDYIDMLFLHRFDSKTPLEDIVYSLGNFLRAGKILYWGVSRWPLDKLQVLMQECEKQGVPLPSGLQEPHNYIFPVPPDVREFASLHRLALFLYSPLARGALTGKYQNGVPARSRGADKKYADSLGGLEKKQHARMLKLMELTRIHKLTPAQLAYLYVLQSCPESVMLCGFSRASQISEAEKSLNFISARIGYD